MLVTGGGLGKKSDTNGKLHGDSECPTITLSQDH